MRAAILTALAVTAALAPAAAQQAGEAAKPAPEHWAYLRFPDGAMAWNLHAGRLSENNNIAEGQRLLYYSQPQVVDGQAISWAQDFWKINCSANTLQIKSGEELSSGLTTLFRLNAGEPRPIATTSTDNILKTVYCDNKEIAGVRFADGILGVMEEMMKPQPVAQ